MDAGASSDPTTSTAPAPITPILYESVLEIHWSNGTQTSHYMFGPAPGSGAALNPDDQWRYPLRAATANAVDFYFNYPTIHADYVIWRVVWIPGMTEARLQIGYTPPGWVHGSLTPHPTDNVVSFTPFDNAGAVDQKVEHPLAYPRPVDVDVTEAFNAAVDKGQHAQFTWQVRAISGT